MNVLQVTYDLRAPGRNYASLHSAIKARPNWCHPLESTWVVVTNESSSELLDDLLGHIDANDGLLVAALTGQAAWYGLAPAVSNWLKSQLEMTARS